MAKFICLKCKTWSKFCTCKDKQWVPVSWGVYKNKLAGSKVVKFQESGSGVLIAVLEGGIGRTLGLWRGGDTKSLAQWLNSLDIEYYFVLPEGYVERGGSGSGGGYPPPGSVYCPYCKRLTSTKVERSMENAKGRLGRDV